LKERIRAELRLTASAGGAPSKFVAKVASDLKKPDGLVIVTPGRVEAFLAPLPVDRLWGVGPVTAARFQQVGLRTIGQVAAADPEWLAATFGRVGREYWLLARGVDDRPVVPHRDPKSISAETTFPRDLTDPETVLTELASQAAEVAERLRKHGMTGRTVVLKVRYSDFSTVTRSLTPGVLVEGADLVLELATRLLFERTDFPGRAVRLVGLGVAGLVDESVPVQLELFPRD
ncbi:MAG: DNA polymerase IV, partial [Candidatus Eremiobacterota bacterium]